MAIAPEPPRQRIVLPLLIVLIGIGCTFFLWRAADRAFLDMSRAQAPLIHNPLQHQLSLAFNHYEGLAASLARTLAETPSPDQAFAAFAEGLFPRFPALLAVERYSTLGDGDGPGDWRLVQVIAPVARAFATDRRPMEVPHWQALIRRAWEDLTPGLTPLDDAMGALLNLRADEPRVRLFWPVPPVEGRPRQLLALVISPSALLGRHFQLIPGVDVKHRLYDLDSQSTDPIAVAPAAISEPETTFSVKPVVLDSGFSVADRRWQLRTTYYPHLPERAEGALQSIVAAGLGLTLAVTLLCLRLLGRIAHHRRARARTIARLEDDQHALQNITIEREILSRALRDSEQRTRDFIELGDAFVCELDENWHIGFISPQIASLVERPPAELAGIEFVELIAPPRRDHVREALRTCERERRAVRIDTVLQQGDGPEHPISLRCKPITDGLGPRQGFRAVAWRR